MRNLQTTINILERAKKNNGLFDIHYFQYSPTIEDHYVKTERELHSCGNSACVAGYIAVSPEFKKIGGQVGVNGTPVMKNDKDKHFQCINPIFFWFGSVLEEEQFFIDSLCGFRYNKEFWGGVSNKDVTIDMAIDKLKEGIERFGDED
jgi:hypothetical protein